LYLNTKYKGEIMGRKKKTIVASQGGVELPEKNGGNGVPVFEKQQAEAIAEGVIDLDPTNADYVAAIEPVSKPKRKYTKHVRINAKQTVITPTFVDRVAIRAARIQLFTDYVDGQIEFASAAQKDDKFRNLDAVAKEIEDGK
jgi:hypothetical protein